MKRNRVQKNVVQRRAKAATTYEVDIAQDIKEMKQEFRHEFKELRKDLDEWKTIFDRQLTKLNDNMEQVLSQLADHEARITELEKNKTAQEAKTSARTEMVKLGWMAAKWVLAAGILVGGVFGAGGALKFLFQQ